MVLQRFGMQRILLGQSRFENFCWTEALMKISTILDHVDSGHFALPVFQRGYVWNKEQVRSLFDSMYKKHPIGTLLAWVTESENALYRGDGPISAGVVKLLLDGQQRITTLYGVVRGKPPKFFDGNCDVLKNLMFNMETDSFEYYQKGRMGDDSAWLNVTDVMKNGNRAIQEYATKFAGSVNFPENVSKITRLLSIMDIDLHIEEVTGSDKSLDVVVDIFNRVNSGGTKLSKGDLALAKICADWPEARDVMKGHLADWANNGFNFNLDWLLRSVNTVVTGEAKFQFLHDSSQQEVENGLKIAVKHINTALNMISGRLGLDHDRVLFGRFGIPIIVRYLQLYNGKPSLIEQDQLLFWYLQSGMWGRFSGSTESFLDKDLAILENGTGIEGLIEELKLWHGSLRVEPSNFASWSMGSRFYPILYMLTRNGQSQDWGTGLPLRANLLGRMNTLDVHHIFPRAQLYKNGYSKSEVNSLANYCFQTKDSNIKISDKLPEKYFLEIEDAYPGALSSQWIPENQDLWRINRYRDFLTERRSLLCKEINSQLIALLHGQMNWVMEESSQSVSRPKEYLVQEVDENSETIIQDIDDWVASKNLPRGEKQFECLNQNLGEEIAILDIAWPNGIQEGFSQPIALLLNDRFSLEVAASQGFRCFSSVQQLKEYIEEEILN